MWMSMPSWRLYPPADRTTVEGVAAVRVMVDKPELQEVADSSLGVFK
jgi:hypothetical protein